MPAKKKKVQKAPVEVAATPYQIQLVADAQQAPTTCDFCVHIMQTMQLIMNLLQFVRRAKRLTAKKS